MATTTRTTRYPQLPRKPKPEQRKRKLRDEVSALYAEVMEGEAVLLLKLPGWQSAEKLVEAGLAGLVKLASSEDREYALKASLALIEYGTRQLEKAGVSASGAAIMTQLESLYRKALPGESESEDLVEPEEKPQSGE